MDKYRIVAFIGESASGKDSFIKSLCSKYPKLNKIVSSTTRPKREKEREGVDYFYITEQEFTDRVLDFTMLEATIFNDWFYGTELRALKYESLNLGAYNPDGVRALKENPNIDVLVFYVKTSDKTRLIRALNREKNPDVSEIVRRYKADKIDFSNIDFDYITLENEDEQSNILCEKNLDIIAKAIFDHFG